MKAKIVKKAKAATTTKVGMPIKKLIDNRTASIGIAGSHVTYRISGKEGKFSATNVATYIFGSCNGGYKSLDHNNHLVTVFVLLPEKKEADLAIKYLTLLNKAGVGFFFSQDVEKAREYVAKYNLPSPGIHKDHDKGQTPIYVIFDHARDADMGQLKGLVIGLEKQSEIEVVVSGESVNVPMTPNYSMPYYGYLAHLKLCLIRGLFYFNKNSVEQAIYIKENIFPRMNFVKVMGLIANIQGNLAYGTLQYLDSRRDVFELQTYFPANNFQLDKQIPKILNYKEMVSNFVSPNQLTISQGVSFNLGGNVTQTANRVAVISKEDINKLAEGLADSTVEEYYKQYKKLAASLRFGRVLSPRSTSVILVNKETNIAEYNVTNLSIAEKAQLAGPVGTQYEQFPVHNMKDNILYISKVGSVLVNKAKKDSNSKTSINKLLISNLLGKLVTETMPLAKFKELAKDYNLLYMPVTSVAIV